MVAEEILYRVRERKIVENHEFGCDCLHCSWQYDYLTKKEYLKSEEDWYAEVFVFYPGEELI